MSEIGEPMREWEVEEEPAILPQEEEVEEGEEAPIEEPIEEPIEVPA